LSPSKLTRFVLTVVLAAVPVFTFAQVQESWKQIQHDFENGSISADDAVSRQLDLIHPETSATPVVQNYLKCATPVMVLAHKHNDELSTETHLKLGQLRQKQKLASEQFISGSGLFTIYYETDGADAVPLDDANSNSVPDYVEWVAEAADSSYRHEVLTLAFPDPIPNGSSYSVYLADLSAYGLTYIDGTEPAGTYIEMENDFIGFPENDDPEGDQKGAIKVTMAHEFKHAIQYFQNSWTGDPDRWSEMDATLYEEIVYDDVNDYYNYLSGFADNLFVTPNRSLIPGSYEDITWALYFHERYGDEFWTAVWDYIQVDNNITWFSAISTALGEYEVEFEEAVLEAAIWHYASGPFNSTQDFGFDEASFYPTPVLEDSFDSLQTELTDLNSLTRFAAEYYEFDLLQPSTELVQVDIQPASSDLQFGLIAFYENNSVETRLITKPVANELLKTQLTWNWEAIDKLGLVVFNSSSSGSSSYQFQVFDYFPTNAEGIQLEQNFPNPFNPRTNIRVVVPFTQHIKLEVYDSIGRKVRVLRDGLISAGIRDVEFNGNGLASGLYFYRLESNEGVQIKKMMLLK
jgi:hypothetical protein